MPADRLLGTLLRALQTYSPQQETSRFLGTAVSLYTTLANPLNITLLTSQLLQSSALWTRPDGLRSSLSFISVINTACARLIEREAADQADNADHFHAQHEPHVPVAEWVHAVISGLDERSPRHRHLLVLCGLLVGFGPKESDVLPSSLWRTIQSAFVKAANLTLADQGNGEAADLDVVLAMNHSFPHLSDFERKMLNYDAFLPVIMHAVLHSDEGLKSGLFLSAVDEDVIQVSSKQFGWSASSASFYQVQKMSGSPLLSSLGPLSRLAAHTVEQVKDSWLVSSLIDDLAEFAGSMHAQWRRNKLSEVDVAEEMAFLDEEARTRTLPVLRQMMRSVLFSVVIILRSAVGRVLADRTLANNQQAPQIARQTLHILRDLNFIFSRLGSAAFSQYTFTYLTAIDMLNAYPAIANEYIQSIAPTSIGRIPAHPLDRAADLFFLNVSEHFTLVLSPELNEQVLIRAAGPYLTTGADPHLLPIFEAAHSVMLAVFAAPQMADATARHLPFYVDTLFRVFPQNLSARQFRLAFRNLVKITSPPSHIAITQPLLAAVLLELVYGRASNAPTTPLPASPTTSLPSSAGANDQGLESAPQLSEQAILIHTLIDALPAVSLDLLEEWLPLTADLINRADLTSKEHCRRHLWDTMTNGSMDSERSQICVAWWTTQGGREAMMFEEQRRDLVMMSGALPDARETKL
ncbi:hypothetical protein MBLNU457_6594t2 [Dothideomycetes sp. NU457]